MYGCGWFMLEYPVAPNGCKSDCECWGPAECGDGVWKSPCLLLLTEGAYEVLESYDWLLMECPLDDPARGEEPTDDALACCW